MTLPMMLRTTTQRGLRSSAAIRTLSRRSAAAARAICTGFSVTPTRVTGATTSAQRCFATSSSRSFSMSRRWAQPTSKYTASPVTDGEYHKLSNHVLDSLTETFETLLEEADVDALEEAARAKHQGAIRGSPASEWDIECASGVMNLRCGVHGTWVINKQPPNKQIWLSSPKSGPKRFDYDADSKTWFCFKEGETSTLHEILQGELSQVFDTEVEVLLEDE
ncbi:Frataxin-like protein, mitochondrial [Pseudozyma hubeiensis]|nr:Frataxin-like protein, mitochondrial [Pseudozyma hubeiensis]